MPPCPIPIDPSSVVSVADRFGTTATAFGVVHLAFQATFKLGKYISARSYPSEQRLSDLQKIVDDWKDWIKTLSAADRVLVDRECLYSVAYMERELRGYELLLGNLFKELRAAGIHARYINSDLNNQFTNAETTIRGMHQDFNNSTKAYRKAQAPSMAHSIPLPPSPSPSTVSFAQPQDAQDAVEMQVAVAEINQQWSTLTRQVPAHDLQNSSVREAYNIANNVLRSILGSTQTLLTGR